MSYNKYMKFGAYIILIFSAFAFILSGYKLFLVYTHPLKYKEEIEEYSDMYNLPYELVASVINVESSFDENAKSSKGAIGLMQIKYSTAKYIVKYYSSNDYLSTNNLVNVNENNISLTSENDLFNPKINIEIGCMYLRYLINKFSSVDTALASYNAGETRVRVWLSDSNYSQDSKTLYNIPYKETKNYVKKVNNNINYYKKLLA